MAGRAKRFPMSRDAEIAKSEDGVSSAHARA